MKGFKKLRIVIPLSVYLLFFLAMGYLYFHPIRCAYERNITEISENSYATCSGEYIYEVESSTVDYKDPFYLAQVQGWLIQPKGNFYGPVNAEIVLSSETAAYSVRAYAVKRADVYYLDQSNPKSKDLRVGFLARFPTEQFPAGVYKIGFLVNEQGTASVLWTESELSIDRAEEETDGI